MRIYDALSLETNPHNPLAQHLVGLTEILAFQGRITLTLEPIKRKLWGCGPRVSLGGRDQPVHCIREEKVRRLFIMVTGCVPLGREQRPFVVPKGGDQLIVEFVR